MLSIFFVAYEAENYLHNRLPPPFVSVQAANPESIRPSVREEDFTLAKHVRQQVMCSQM